MKIVLYYIIHHEHYYLYLLIRGFKVFLYVLIYVL